MRRIAYEGVLGLSFKEDFRFFLRRVVAVRFKTELHPRSRVLALRLCHDFFLLDFAFSAKNADEVHAARNLEQAKPSLLLFASVLFLLSFLRPSPQSPLRERLYRASRKSHFLASCFAD